MEFADRTRVLKRVTEVLNLCDPGTYASTISARNKTRNAGAIADFTDEAGLMVLQAIAERPNEFRSVFLADSGVITTSGAAMPDHIGPPAAVKITLWAGGTVREGKRLGYERIQSYRENPSTVYDRKNHAEQGSSLGGYYDIWDDRFFFTGYSAILSLARKPIRADTATSVPSLLENAWIKLAIGQAAKVGTGGYTDSVIGGYGKEGMADLEAFKAGNRAFKEVDDPAPTSAVHNLSK